MTYSNIKFPESEALTNKQPIHVISFLKVKRRLTNKQYMFKFPESEALTNKQTNKYMLLWESGPNNNKQTFTCYMLTLSPAESSPEDSGGLRGTPTANI